MRLKAFFPVTGAVFGAISPTCTAFLSPGAPRVRITNVVRRPSKLSHQHPYHHERALRWTKSRIFKDAFEHRSATAEDTTTDNGGEAEAVRQEVGRIREARLRAGQIKAELDSLEVSYAGLLEKSEFEQALAEARVTSFGQRVDQAPAAEDAEGDEVTTFSDTQKQSDKDLKQEPRSEELGEEGESSVGGLDSEDAETSSSNPKREPATESFTQSESVEKPEAEPEPKQEPSTESFTQPESVEERMRERESPPEQSSRGSAPEVEPVPEPTPASEPVTVEPVTEPVSVEESPASPETSPSTPDVENAEGQSSGSVDPGSGVVSSGIDEEISRIREARMSAGQIKAELDSMGISYIGLLEKAEFVKKLAEARTNPAATGARDGSGESATREVNVGPGEEAAAEGPVNASAASVDPQTSGEGMRSNEDAVADVIDDEEKATIPPPPPPSRPIGEETSNEPTRIDIDEESEDRSNEGKARSTVDREEVLAMRISQIKQELDERGVTYRGLLEKSEFVNLLIDARERGITAPPMASAGVGGGNAEATGSGDGDAEKRTDEFDPSYKEVETKKMKQNTDGGGSAGPGGMPGNIPAGAGFDIGSILGAMGGMGGGGANAGSPGVPGGVDIGSILGAMGGRPPSEGGSASGGAAPGMGDILGKLMNNPKAQAVFQKAQSNPKVMAAIQDVSQNGLGAMAKYSNDPEIRDVIEDLKSLF